MSQIDFKEVQRFRVWWAWLGVIILNLFFIYASRNSWYSEFPSAASRPPTLHYY